MNQFEANLGALDVTLSEAQRAALDEVSAPTLNFPAENNAVLAPNMQFAGATVDGRPSIFSRPDGGAARLVVADVTDESAVEAAVLAAIGDTGRWTSL